MKILYRFINYNADWLQSCLGFSNGGVQFAVADTGKEFLVCQVPYLLIQFPQKLFFLQPIQIPYFCKQFLPLDSQFLKPSEVTMYILQKLSFRYLYEIFFLLQIQKKHSFRETILRNTVVKENREKSRFVLSELGI